MFKLALIAVTAAVAVSPALAGATRLSDVQYIQAGRCHGLLSSEALGAADDSAIKAMMKSEAGAHAQLIIDRADEAKKEAQRQAKRAKAERKATLIAERDGACQAFNGAAGATTTAGAAAAHSTN